MKAMVLSAFIMAMTIWGNIESYTNSYIILDGKRYEYARNVIIDTYSLKGDRRGNVRVELDSYGKAKEIYFYGIDMPDVIKRFKR